MEKKQIILLDAAKVFMSIKFLKLEETEVFTEYGKGLIEGLIDPSTEKKLPVIPVDKYLELEKKYLKLKNKPWWKL